MKKLMFLLVGLMAVQMAWCADGTPIPQRKLPAPALQFIQTFFPNATISSAERDTDGPNVDYEVVLSNGVQLEFDATGQWMEIQSVSGVPTGVMIDPIRSYTAQNRPNEPITSIERNRRGYEVTFSSGAELQFDANGKVVARRH